MSARIVRRRRNHSVRHQVRWPAVIAVVFAMVAGIITYNQQSAPTHNGPEIVVFCDPDYMDSTKWIQYLSDKGFNVRVVHEPDVSVMHHVFDVPARLQSHHTAIVSGYIIEGHVPAEDITRLLDEKPNVRGIAVPGIPGASPGMEAFSGDRRSYQVIAFNREGTTSIFSTH